MPLSAIHLHQLTKPAAPATSNGQKHPEPSIATYARTLLVSIDTDDEETEPMETRSRLSHPVGTETSADASPPLLDQVLLFERGPLTIAEICNQESEDSNEHLSDPLTAHSSSVDSRRSERRMTRRLADTIGQRSLVVKLSFPKPQSPEPGAPIITSHDDCLEDVHNFRSPDMGDMVIDIRRNPPSPHSSTEEKESENRDGMDELDEDKELDTSIVHEVRKARYTIDFSLGELRWKCVRCHALIGTHSSTFVRHWGRAICLENKVDGYISDDYDY